MKTKFAGKSPFATKKPAPPVDVSKLTIANDPLPTHRVQADNKYSALFEKLAVGQCIVCEAGTSQKIAHALNTWLDRQGRTNMVKSANVYEKDGKGRVWLLEPRAVAKLKAVG